MPPKTRNTVSGNTTGLDTVVTVTSTASSRRKADDNVRFVQPLQLTTTASANQVSPDAITAREAVGPPPWRAPEILKSGSTESTTQTLGSTQTMNPGMPPPPTPAGIIFRSTSNTSSLHTHDWALETKTDTRPIDMSMTKPTEMGQRFQVRNCIKEHIFHHVKFLDKDVHGYFDMSLTTVPGNLISYCFKSGIPVDQAFTFWRTARPWLFKSHTHCRNNYIKGMQNAYMGTLKHKNCINMFLDGFELLTHRCSLPFLHRRFISKQSLFIGRASGECW